MCRPQEPCIRATHCNMSQPVAGLPRALTVIMWPTLPRLRLSTSHQHWWSLELSISSRTVSRKESVVEVTWIDTDGWKMVMVGYGFYDWYSDTRWDSYHGVHCFKHLFKISTVVDPCQRLSVNSKEVVNSRNFAILRSSQCSVPRYLAVCLKKTIEALEDEQDNFPTSRSQLFFGQCKLCFPEESMSKWSTDQEKSTCIA